MNIEEAEENLKEELKADISKVIDNIEFYVSVGADKEDVIESFKDLKFDNNFKTIPLKDEQLKLLKDIMEIYKDKVDHVEVYADSFTIYFK